MKLLNEFFKDNPEILKLVDEKIDTVDRRDLVKEIVNAYNAG